MEQQTKPLFEELIDTLQKEEIKRFQDFEKIEMLRTKMGDLQEKYPKDRIIDYYTLPVKDTIGRVNYLLTRPISQDDEH